jgi:hypothetical protein
MNAIRANTRPHSKHLFPPDLMVRLQNVIVTSVQTTTRCFETSSNSPLAMEINAAIKSYQLASKARWKSILQRLLPNWSFCRHCCTLWFTNQSQNRGSTWNVYHSGSFSESQASYVLQWFRCCPLKLIYRFSKLASLHWSDKRKIFLRARIQTSLN